jgi:LacI family transcriptional regulator, xylobiose transport system transcriptional regulator
MSQEAVDAEAPARATLSRIAEDADVSMSTVSKVLNGRTGVSDATRARIEELLHEHGYNRRGSAQSAALIELVFSQLDSAWAMEIVRGVENVARDNGMSVVLTESGDRHSPDPDWIDGVMRRRPAGVILVFSDLSADHKRQLRTRNIPFVIVDPAGDPAPDVPSIGSANWSGGLLAARHLIALGHREIAMITGPDDMLCSRARVSGFRSALEAAGIPIREEFMITGDFQREDGLVHGRELLSLPNPPTAIFAGSDLMALGLYEAAHAMGVSIPGELSVVGYDDLQVAAWVGPPLTTVRQPLTEMAEEATRLAIRLHNDPDEENLRIDLATSLVVRNSTARPGR